MGLVYPQSVQDVVPAIASILDSPEPLLRELAVNALGRIGEEIVAVLDLINGYHSFIVIKEENREGWTVLVAGKKI